MRDHQFALLAPRLLRYSFGQALADRRMLAGGGLGPAELALRFSNVANGAPGISLGASSSAARDSARISFPSACDCAASPRLALAHAIARRTRTRGLPLTTRFRPAHECGASA